MRRSNSVVIAVVLFTAAVLFSTGLAHAQNRKAGVTPSAASELLTHGGGVWVLDSVGGQRIESDCLGKFSLQFKPDHQAESVGCHEGGTYSATSEWKLSTSTDHQVTLELGNEATSLELREMVNGPKHAYFMRLKLLSVLDPKSGKLLIHEYRFKETSPK